jgi:hypothetical protein
MLRHGLKAVFWVAMSGAAAADYVEFRSPTGNISCGLYSDKAGASVRCDMSELTPSYTKRPAGCDLDWGSSFAVNDKGKGILACVSDPAAGPGAAVLRYGQAISLGGISCVSAETGMTCTNAQGHGFSISKAQQKLY